MFVLDISPIITWFNNQSIISLLGTFGSFLGGLFIVYVILRFAWRRWVKHVRGKFSAQQEYVLLAVDVPKNNEQLPKAVEGTIAHLAAIKEEDLSWFDKYMEGIGTLTVSLEIVSIEGRIQFLVRAPAKFRDLVEAAVYSSYADAEIKEVSDYTENAPEEFPDEVYELWGTDIVLYNNNPYPIRTHTDFGIKNTGEIFVDPVVDLLESMGKIGRGEQIWLQFVIKPVGTRLKKQGKKVINKLLGKSTSSVWQEWKEIIWPVEIINKKESKKNLSPGEKTVLEAVERKISKIAFKTRIRFIYLAEKEIFHPQRAVNGVLGAFNQFSTLDMNGFKTDDKVRTKRHLFKHEARLSRMQNFILSRYRKRKINSSLPRKYWKMFTDFFRHNPLGRSYYLNVEELATLYHFPVVTLIKAPLVKKTGSKRGEPPFDLPTASI